MSVVAVLAALLLAPTLAAAADDAPASPRIQRLQQDTAAGEAAALPAFWDEVRRDGAPLVEPAADAHERLVTFLWRSQADTHVTLLADFADYVPHMTLARLHGTDVWFRTFRFRDDARFLYELAVDDPNWPFVDGDQVKDFTAPQPDPLNPHRYEHAAPHILSIVELPAAPPLLPSTPDPSIPHGTVGRFQALLHSDILGNDRPIFVYQPPGYDAGGAPYPLLLFGTSYTSQTRLPLILDDLIAKRRIPAVVAAFIHFPPEVQDKESGGGEAFGDFVARELLPWVRERMHVTDDPRRVVCGGASAGGHSMAFVAWQHPEAIGNVLAQSGAFWRGRGRTAAWWADPAHDEGREGFARAVASAPTVPVRFWLTVGRLETGRAYDAGMVSMVAASRHVRDVLQARGCDVTLVESGGGHDPFNWESTLPDALIGLLGPP
jgi:enterochelin esterase family protein